MKLIVAFICGVISTLICILIGCPNYSDYRKRVEIDFVMNELKPVQTQLEQRILNSNDQEIQGLSDQYMYIQKISTEGDDDKDKGFGQIIVLIPREDNGKII